MHKRPDITTATKQRFIDAFCELYTILPLEKITVKAIAEKAGYNRITFYEYFKDSYDVLETLENEMFGSIHSAIIKNIQNADMFEDFLSIFNHILSEHQTIATLLFNGSNSSGTIQRCKEKFMPEFLNAFASNIDDMHSRYLLEFYLSGVISVFCYWIKNDQKLPIEDLGKMIKTILEHGVLPQLKTI